MLEYQERHDIFKTDFGGISTKILIGILVGWSVCALMTALGAFGPHQKLARTDRGYEIIKQAEWFRISYPGKMLHKDVLITWIFLHANIHVSFRLFQNIDHLVFIIENYELSFGKVTWSISMSLQFGFVDFSLTL